MNRALIAGVCAGAVVVGTTLVVTYPTMSSLPDVQVPAIELSNAGQTDATAAWLGLFTQVSGGNAEAPTSLLDSGQLGIPAHTSLVVIEPQDSDADYAGLLDDVDKIKNPLEAVTSAINGPDVVTYLSPGNGTNGS